MDFLQNATHLRVEVGVEEVEQDAVCTLVFLLDLGILKITTFWD